LATRLGFYKTNFRPMLTIRIYIQCVHFYVCECASLWLTLAWRWFCKNRNM